MILIVHNDPEEVRAVRGIFFKMSFNTSGASYDETEYCITHERIDAVVFLDVYTAEPTRSVCRNLRMKYPKITLTAAYREGYGESIKEALWYYCDSVVSYDSPSTLIVEEIIKSIDRKCGYSYGTLRACGIYLPINSPDAFIDDLRLSLTPIERLILRYLMLIHPNHATQEEIYEHCFNPLVSSGPENISAHIHDINKKTVYLMDVKLISFFPSEGYIIDYKSSPCPTESAKRRIYRICNPPRTNNT